MGCLLPADALASKYADDGMPIEEFEAAGIVLAEYGARFDMTFA